MKRGKYEEKIMGPMFPRLHVNDTEKGGPRAPPRNKMALYEQLSIPSQRFNHGVLPLNPSNSANSFPSASSSQGSGHERGMFFSLHLPPSTHQTEKMHACYSDLNTPLAQLEQKTKLDEEEFTVSIFVQSATGQDHSKNKSSAGRERLSPFSSVSSDRSMKFRNAIDIEPKQTSIIGLNLRQKGRSLSKENSKEIVSGREQSVKSASNLLAREKTDGFSKQTNACLNQEHRDHPADNISRLQNTDASLQQKYRAWSQPNNTECGDGVFNELFRGIENGNSSFSRRDFRPEEQRRSDDPINDCENHVDMTCGSLQTGNVDRGDDISETSMVDSIPRLDISPDDVVGIIGQKHFWKARRAIANQQRVFAVQVFELHRLIKVQKLIAGLPHLLLEDDAYLGKPLNGPPAKKIPLDYIVKPPPHIVTNKDDSGKPFSGNLPPELVTTDAKMGSWSFHQPSGHQWLIPVMSPSEGLIYKPYHAPGFMGPVCGGCGPPGSNLSMCNHINPTCGITASHHHYQGIGVPSVSHGYFHPYGMPVMNPAISGSTVEQINHFAGPVSHGHPGQLSGGGANFNMPHQSLCNVPSQKNGAISDLMKLHASKDNELQGSTASSPTGAGLSMERTNVLPLFPMLPVVHAPEGATQPHATDRPTRVIKVVPHNARSATESAARIFQSIQEQRKQSDSV